MKSEMSESGSYWARIKESSSSIVSCVLLSQCGAGCKAECMKAGAPRDSSDSLIV